MLIEHADQAHHFVLPFFVAGGLVQVEQAVHEEGVVVEEAVALGGALAVGVQQAAVFLHGAEHELGRFLRGLGVLGFVEQLAAFGEGADHQAVPAGEHPCAA